MTARVLPATAAAATACARPVWDRATRSAARRDTRAVAASGVDGGPDGGVAGGGVNGGAGGWGGTGCWGVCRPRGTG
ncbi:hypothetical protein PSU4_33330 [Pseudonocardia sulfidoxydans NBRC 16205]|uniref:Uncharacterized protein n=1 Tax=Pseudonocardia sulfidoxydans NBRC 16205 TaxID=1223511 RepID=A0A511DHW0_9PSEU|nr:hypothetical protein PSU4_33330 [Pseudonocardia sulfidoxydans NBRC 16205]